MPQRREPGVPDFQSKERQFCPRKTCPTPCMAARHHIAIRDDRKCHFSFLTQHLTPSHTNVKHTCIVGTCVIHTQFPSSAAAVSIERLAFDYQ